MSRGEALVLTEPHARRRVAPLPVLAVEGWRIKTHGISYRGPAPRPELVYAARLAAERALPRPATGQGRHGVGFLGIHDGRDACFAYVDWWARENELHHHGFLAPIDDPGALTAVSGSGFTACVWDLALIHHERRAWVGTVLDNPAGPDLDAYLACELTGWV